MCPHLIDEFLLEQRSIEKVSSVDLLATRLPSATDKLKAQGVRFSTSKAADHSYHTTFLKNMTAEGRDRNPDTKEPPTRLFSFCVFFIFWQTLSY